jgi:D-lactate dehydrogenase
MIAMRCAGTDNVNIKACRDRNIVVTNSPIYSPYAVAEFAIGLLLNLNRKIHVAVERVKQYNFSLNGLVGFDLHEKTVGVIGTGKIGARVISILEGFDCRILCYDVYKNTAIEQKHGYVDLDYLYANSDIISVHVPLLESTRYMLNKESFDKMKDGVLIINTSRGALINTQDLIKAIKSRKVGGAALDVYEGEKNYFFEDVSQQYIEDNLLTQILAQHNIIVTSHQAFLTNEALMNIAKSTLDSIKEFASGKETFDYAILAQCLNKPKGKADNAEEVREAFKIFDKENNGLVSLSELRHVLTTLGEVMTTQEVDELLKDAKVDKDGNINYNQFVSMIMPNK